jgi:hypothetical protein
MTIKLFLFLGIFKKSLVIISIIEYIMYRECEQTLQIKLLTVGG